MESKINTSKYSPVMQLFIVLALWGFGYFAYLIADNRPEIAWPAYLINLLLWSAIAQGGLLFSIVMHVTKARWSHSLSGLSHAFAAFFPLSFGLFLILFLGQDTIFPWLHANLDGKEVWLNVPFLFARDLIGLFVLYGLGWAYLYYALGLTLGNHPPRGKIRVYLHKRWSRRFRDVDRCKARMSVFGVLYMIAYAFVLSLLAFDLIMSADPHWISTLFGAYAFVKAFYIGLGALIILASVVALRYGDLSGLTATHFHDLGKLFFGFCLIWGDFFYAQFVVIWYGNLPEEASYIIQRTMLSPWKSLAWVVLCTCFIVPFLILLNRKVKTKPVFMAVLCSVVIVGIGLEHLLLLGPALSPDISGFSQGLAAGLIFVGFFGLMGLALRFFLNLFPELVLAEEQETH